jgi:hypothetical protein
VLSIFSYSYWAFSKLCTYVQYKQQTSGVPILKLFSARDH